MEKTRKIKTLTIVALITAILGLTVAFAALSQTLKVKTFTTISGGSFEVVIQNTVYDLKKKYGTVADIPSIQDFSITLGNSVSGEKYREYREEFDLNEKKDQIKGITTNLKVPGDYYELLFMVVNYSEHFAAKVSGVSFGTPICVSDTGNKTDEDLVCNNLEFKVERITESIDSNINFTPIEQGFELPIYSSSDYSPLLMKVKISLNKDLTTVPTSNVTISNLNCNLNWSQN